MLSRDRIAIIGAGKIGEALIAGLLNANAISRKQIIATTRRSERAVEVRRRYGVRASTKNCEAVAASNIVVLCVKPQAMLEVLQEIRTTIKPRHLVISVAASVSTRYIERHLGGKIPVIRTMPNTPCQLREGMTGICRGTLALDKHLQKAKQIFDAIGRSQILEEKYLDAVTGLSASGPAFIYVVIESLAEAGVKVGLPRETATELAAQTVLGAARMVLESHEHPAKLKDFVTTPAGCTIDGLLELEEGGLRVTLIKAVVRATARAHELLDT
ncbi:MAG: pyrroline-5-carboxylate reductase [Acidobacteriota bacterium]